MLFYTQQAILNIVAAFGLFYWTKYKEGANCYAKWF